MMLIYNPQNRVGIKELYNIWSVLSQIFIGELNKSKGNIKHLIDNDLEK